MKKLLLALLIVAFVIELVMTVGGFLMPEMTLGAFHVEVSEISLFLGHVIAWFLLFVTLIIGYAIYQVRKNDQSGWCLSYILGAWWMGIGTTLFVCYGRTDNLFLDAAKGLLICIAAYKSCPNQPARA